MTTAYSLSGLTHRCSHTPMREHVGLYVSRECALDAQKTSTKYGYYGYEITEVTIDNVSNYAVENGCYYRIKQRSVNSN